MVDRHIAIRLAIEPRGEILVKLGERLALASRLEASTPFLPATKGGERRCTSAVRSVDPTGDLIRKPAGGAEACRIDGAGRTGTIVDEQHDALTRIRLQRGRQKRASDDALFFHV